MRGTVAIPHTHPFPSPQGRHTHVKGGARCVHLASQPDEQVRGSDTLHCLLDRSHVPLPRGPEPRAPSGQAAEKVTARVVGEPRAVLCVRGEVPEHAAHGRLAQNHLQHLAALLPRSGTLCPLAWHGAEDKAPHRRVRVSLRGGQQGGARAHIHRGHQGPWGQRAREAMG